MPDQTALPAAATAHAQPYVVLARKYRPQNFTELKGQDALVQTLQNAIALGRLHHAYVLTGIRGVGKTTTARIIAKALNCADGPALQWQDDDANVQAIAAGTHVDVLEFDAASHTGVDDIRDLFEGVAYAPVQGRYKVYIIDEVHMLSKQAFNALLKTLEEPPANVVFIFATTEVHKIPVTVLSRCQRFDLARVPVATLVAHYTEILGKEGIAHEAEALHMIAQAADGSVRDGLSLLDQSIALGGEKGVQTTVVQNMLGVADKTQVYELLNLLFQSKAEAMLTKLEALYAQGQNPVLFVQDMCKAVDFATQAKLVPSLLTRPETTELDRTHGGAMSQQVPLENLARLYQMLLAVVKELKEADRPYEAFRMACVRLCHLAALPPVAHLLSAAEKQAATEAPAATPAPAPTETFQPAQVDTTPKAHTPVQAPAMPTPPAAPQFSENPVPMGEPAQTPAPPAASLSDKAAAVQEKLQKAAEDPTIAAAMAGFGGGEVLKVGE